MVHLERILCPVDFSEFSARAYDYAHSLARHYHAKLFLQHVLDFNVSAFAYYVAASYMSDLLERVRHDGRSQLEEFAKRPAAYGAPPECVLYQGAPAKSILSFAEEQNVNLIVMGSHGLNGADRVALGSVAEKVIRKAPCSVLLVGTTARDFVNPASEQDPIQLRKILCCTDLSLYSNRALEHATSIAAEYNAEITLLYVLEDKSSSPGLQNATRQLQALAEAIPPETCECCTIKPLVRAGKPYQEIIQQALEAQTDIVIMGVRGRNAVDLAVFGSTTYRVIQLGPCPVLAVQV